MISHYDNACRLLDEVYAAVKKRYDIPSDQVDDKESEFKMWAAIAQNLEPERQAQKIRLRAEKNATRIQREERKKQLQALRHTLKVGRAT